MSARDLLALFKDTYIAWRRDQATLLSAAVAYYALFSLAPLLIIVVGTAGVVFGPELAQETLLHLIEGALGPKIAAMLGLLIERTGQSRSGPLTTGLGILVLLYSASRVFDRLQIALDTIWEVEPSPGRDMLRLLRKNLLSFLMVLGIGVVLIGSIMIGSTLSLARRHLEVALADQTNALATSVTALPEPTIVFVESLLDGVRSLQAAEFLVSFAAASALFALLFRFVPETDVTWRDVWLGAAVTGGLFAVGKLAIALYLTFANVGTTYGAAGSVIVILLWVNYSAQILFFGAEFAKLYANRFGSRAPTP